MTKGILKTTPIILFIVLLFLPIVFADYTQIGGDDHYFNTETGFFNAQLTDDCSSTDITCTARTIASPTYIPLVADLDADGTNEIIAFDGATVRLYHDSSLTIIDSFTSGVVSAITSAITYDVDGDGLVEVIIAGGNDVEIVEYNGTLIINQSSYLNALTGLSSGTPVILLACDGEERCSAVYEEKDDGCVPCIQHLYGASFNSTEVIDHETTVHTSSSNNNPCLSGFNSMQVADLDGLDGINEFVFSFSDYAADRFGIISFQLNSSGNIVMKDSVFNSDGTTSSSSCDVSNWYVSNSLSYDIDGSSSNGLETAIGFRTGSGDFKIYVYDKNLNFVDDYPELSDGEGIIVSNMMRANAFADTANEDFCIMGYQGTALRRLNLICGSMTSGYLFSHRDFVYDLPVDFNVTGLSLISHATQMSQATTDGNNLDEIVNAYGVWSLDYSFIDELELIWQNPKGNSTVIPADAEQNGREDLLMLTSTNLWYIDDGFTNTGGVLSSYTINPCIDRTWKQNTSVTITATVTDADGDDVSARAMLYAGTANQQDSGWSSNFSSGTTFSFSFTANNTASNAWLEIYGRDVENPAENSSISVQFSVATSGAEFGDCITSESITPIGDETDAEVAQQDVIDTISDGVLGRDDDGNGGISEGWLPVIGFIAVILTFFFVTTTLKGEGITGDALVFLSAMACVITFVALVWLGWIPFWVLLVMLVFALVIISFKFRDKIQGGSTGGI